MIAFRAILTGWHSSRRPMPTMPAKRWRRSKLVMPSSWIGICGRVCLDPGPVIDRAAPSDFAGVLMFPLLLALFVLVGCENPHWGAQCPEMKRPGTRRDTLAVGKIPPELG